MIEETGKESAEDKAAPAKPRYISALANRKDGQPLTEEEIEAAEEEALAWARRSCCS